MDKEKVIEFLNSKFDEKQNQFTRDMLKLGFGEQVPIEAMNTNMIRVSGALAMLSECIDEINKME